MTAKLICNACDKPLTEDDIKFNIQCLGDEYSDEWICHQCDLEADPI